MVDFDKMKNEVLRHAYNQEEEEEILAGIEKLKAMTIEQFNELVGAMDSHIEETRLNIVDDEYGFDEHEAWDYFVEAYPEYSKYSYERSYEIDGLYEKFTLWKNEVTGLVRNSILLSTYESLEDSITEQIQTEATLSACKKYDLPVQIIVYLCPGAMG